jgi:hypothetical protein
MRQMQGFTSPVSNARPVHGILRALADVTIYFEEKLVSFRRKRLKTTASAYAAMMKPGHLRFSILLLAIAFVIVAPQWALSNEAKQKCYYETQCVQYGYNCTKYEAVCLKPVNVCAEYELLCVKHEEKCVEYQYEKKPVQVCVEYGKKCSKYGYKEDCQHVEEQQQQDKYWAQRWSSPQQQQQQAKQFCKKVQICIAEETDYNKCKRYGSAYETVKVCAKYKKVCAKHAEGKCISFVQNCESYGKKCVKEENVCVKYEKVEVCAKDQQKQVYAEQKKPYW